MTELTDHTITCNIINYFQLFFLPALYCAILSPGDRGQQAALRTKINKMLACGINSSRLEGNSTQLRLASNLHCSCYKYHKQH